MPAAITTPAVSQTTRVGPSGSCAANSPRAEAGQRSPIFNSKGRATAYSVCYFPGNPTRNLQPALFVTGTLNNYWTVHRLEPNGAWTTVDSVPIAGVAHNITFDSNGNLFVVGYRDNGLDIGLGWVV